LRLEINGASTVCAGANLPEDRGVRREIHLGSASLQGSVWNEEGEPIPEVTIKVSSKSGTGTVSQLTFRTECNAEGDYRVTGLAEGQWGGGFNLARNGVSYFSLTLARGEARHLDFGMPRPWPSWHGTLRARTGAEHRGRAWLHLVSPSGNPSLWVRPVHDDGRFELRLVP